MSNTNPGQPQAPETPKDEDAIAFAQGIFQLAGNGGTTMLRPLLEAGVPADLRTSSGDSLLILASANGHAETVRLLLHKGANPDLANDRLQTALMLAATGNHTGVIRYLLDAGADRAATDAEGNTALALAQAGAARDAETMLEC